jgi:Rad3-related DNA helicase
VRQAHAAGDRAGEGRSLCLFTSYKNLNAVAAKLRDLPYKLLVQGDGMPRSRLIEEFKEDVSSVLLGVASLWQGLDVPGQACTVVLIDKLPFPGPDDPLGAWYEHSFDRDYAFRRYSMPRMLIRLRQGVGRLIRTRTDYGVVVILDSRIHTKPYGKTVLASLPPFGWIHPTVEAIKPFLEKWEPKILESADPPARDTVPRAWVWRAGDLHGGVGRPLH